VEEVAIEEAAVHFSIGLVVSVGWGVDMMVVIVIVGGSISLYHFGG